MGLVRIKKIHQSYFYFICYLFVCSIVETVSIFLNNIIFINLIQDIYNLLSTILLCFFLFKEPNSLFKSSLIKYFIIIFSCFEFIDIFVLRAERIKIQWGYLVNCLIITAFCLRIIGLNFTRSKDSLYRNPLILISIPLVVSFLYLILINVFMAFLYNQETKGIFIKLYNLIHYLNLFSYVSFSYSFIWAPKRENFL